MKYKCPQNLPTHIAFIMDGNGRWAKKRGLSRKLGHANGVRTLEKIVNEVFSLKIPYITVFAFSTENWQRPKEEVDALMDLIRKYFTEYFPKMTKNNIKINILGDINGFSDDIKQKINLVTETKVKDIKGTFNIALNYGSRDEIIMAVNKLIKEKRSVTQEEFKNYLYTADMPDPDLIVRTSGEMRLSNFLLYQAAYAELCFTSKLWPDFTVKELYKVLREYSKRNRRYGRV